MKKIDKDIKSNRDKLIKLKTVLKSVDENKKINVAINTGKTSLRYIKEFGLDNVLKRLVNKHERKISNLIIVKNIIEDLRKRNRSFDELISAYATNKKSVLDNLERYVKQCTKCGTKVKRTIFYKNEFLCRNCLCPNEDHDRLLVSTVENLHTMHCGDFVKR